ENNEFCLWVISISDPLTIDEAKAVLRPAMPDLDRYLAEGRMEIISHDEWFLKGGAFDSARVAIQYKEKIDEAVAEGFAGMRSSASSAWMAKLGRAMLRDYEIEVDPILVNSRVIAECNFPLRTIGRDELIDMTQAHQFSLVRRNGKWGEGFTGIPALIRARQEIKRLNEELRRLKVRIPTPHEISNYAMAVFSVIATLLISRFLDAHLITSAPVALFLCAIIFSTLRGGLKPGFLAMALSFLAFKYYYVPPVHSLAVEANEIPRLLINILAAFFVVTISAAQRNATESLKRARNVLDGTLQDLKQANESLQSENVERKRVEEEVKKAEDHLRLVLDTTPAMIHTGCPDGYLDYFNKRWLDYVGLPLEEMQGWGWMKSMHPNDVGEVVKMWRVALASGEPFQHEGRLRRADGEYRWMLYHKVPLRDGQGAIVKWHGSCIDIEDRKRAETQLQVLIDAIPQQIWSGPPDGTLDYCNERWRSFRGLTLEELRGEGWQSMLHPDDRDRVLHAWRESVANGTPYEQEERHRGADGTYRWFLARGVPLRDAEGRIARWYGTNTDIEDRKRAEQLLRDSREQLRALTARLESLREEERMRISREIHDELGQNLTGLKMNLLRAERKLEELEATVPVNAVLDTIVSATALVDELVANVQQIATELRPGVLDKLGLGSALQYEARHFLEPTGISWEVRLPETEPDLSAETSITLFRIFQECLTNIVRHARATKVEAELALENGWVTLCVEDNGRGITESEITNPNSLGLLGMTERASLLGGEIVFQRDTHGGTIVMARVPKNGAMPQAKGSS
ncbi:MAG TPA: PAS domain-containing protein, partial [Chthoniobacteraceae bacterium]|nr:PAS domain-containing protein [Chthoniobacteraceae bacterium]